MEDVENDPVTDDDMEEFADAPEIPEQSLLVGTTTADKETSPIRSIPSSFSSVDMLKSMRRESDYNQIFFFINSVGKDIYPHLVLPSKAIMSEKSDRSDRRRVELLESVLQWCAKDCSEGKEEYIGKLLSKAVSRNKEALAKTKEKLSLTVPKISLGDEMRVVGANAPSMNSAEKIAMGVNRVIGQRVFNKREDTRNEWRRHRCKARIGTATVRLEEGSESAVNCAWVENVEEVLVEYLEQLKDDVNITGEFKGQLWLRVAMDKAGEFTKVTASFANFPKCQSRYCQIVVAAYEGPDTYRHLSRCTGTVFEQLSNIRSLKFNGSDVVVAKMLIADNKGMSALLGHSGQASRNPCVICVVPAKPLKEWDIKLDPQRTYNQLEPGMKGPPLVLTSDFAVVPPLLHSSIAPVQIIYERFLEDVAYADTAIALGKELSIHSFPSATAKKPKVLKTAASKDSLQTAVTYGNRFIGKLQLKDHNGTPSSQGTAHMESKICQREYCYGNIGITIPAQIGRLWLQCEQCAIWSHAVCEGFLTIDEQEFAGKGIYTCKECLHATSSDAPFSAVSMFKDSVDSLQKQIELRDALQLARETNGILAAVEEKFRSLKIRTHGYHGGALQGNDAYSFVRNIHLILEPLLLYNHSNPNTQRAVRSLTDKYTAVCYPLRTIFSSLQSRFLETKDVDDLRAACDLLPVRFRTAFPFLLCTPKLHNIWRHFYQFCLKWGTLGLLNEQFLESGHVVFNAIANNYIAYKGTTRRLAETLNQTNATSLLQFKSDLSENRKD